MKFRYEPEDDVLSIWLSNEPVDYAEQEKNVIVHFSKQDKPVLYEILNASAFLKNVSRVLPPDVRRSVLTA